MHGLLLSCAVLCCAVLLYSCCASSSCDFTFQLSCALMVVLFRSTSALSIGLKLGRKIHKLNKEVSIISPSLILCARHTPLNPHFHIPCHARQVQKEGIVATVKTKTARVLDTVDSAYKSAKKKLGQSYHAKIQALHEKLRGEMLS